MTQRDRVLQMLQEAGERGVTTADFLQAYISRFSARINELRNLGYEIDTERLSRSSCLFKLRPVQQFGRVEAVRGEPSGPTAGGKLPPDGPRGGGEEYRHPSVSPATTSGDAKAGGVEAPFDPPALFELPRSGPRSHYEEEAA